MISRNAVVSEPARRIAASSLAPGRIALASALWIACLGSGHAGGLSTPVSDTDCPAGYAVLDLLPPVCFSEATGDIVNVTYRQASDAPSGSGCAAGYERWNALCFHPATGDIELARERTGSPRD